MAGHQVEKYYESGTFFSLRSPRLRGDTMLDPWIIEKIRRREEDRLKDEGRRLELPLESPSYEDRGEASSDEGEERGVTVIDL